MVKTKEWNRTSNIKPTQRHRKSFLALMSVGLLLAIFLIGIAITFYNKPKEEKANSNHLPHKSKKSLTVKPTDIKKKETNPSKINHEKVNTVKSWDGKLVEWPPRDAYKDDEGVWRHPGGQMCFDPRIKPNFIGSKSRHIFNSLSEKHVASLLTAKPGQQFFGTMTLYKSQKFKDDFLKAYLSPTQINEDDSEEDKMIKAEVREVMKDLAIRVKAGEDIGDILTESRLELQRLGQYKQDLIKELKSVMKGESLTDQEVLEYVKAANKMLETKGITPLSVSPLSIKCLKHNVEKMTFETQKKED